MNPIVTISGGGIIGNYISSRLNNNNIESLVIEKSPADLREKEIFEHSPLIHIQKSFWMIWELILIMQKLKR